MQTEPPRPIRLRDYRASDFLVDTVHLEFDLDPAETRVKAKLHVRPNPAVPPSQRSLILDGEQLELERIALNDRVLKPADYDVTPTTLAVKRPPSKPFTLETTTVINPDANKALQGLYRSRGVYCTQCEAQGFRRISYFLDRPDVLATYRVRVTARTDDAPILLSNGNLMERGSLDRGRRHYTLWHDPHPKPCYLFALVGGNLAATASDFTTMSGRKVELAIYVEPGKEARAAWAMDSLKRAMRWDERRFGREYDLDVFNIVAVSDFNMGAMENKGLNIFNDRLILASPETATDTMFEAIESVVAHEYFHNWTGNRITCRDWFQLCLKEGLTVFRDQEFSADERSAPVQRITDVRQLKTHQFAEDAGPLAHPVRPETYLEINNFYTATVYEKGAELVRMIQTITGEPAFRTGMDLYFARHDGQAATVEDFIQCFEDASGQNLTQFRRWYAQAGTPQLTVALTYDRARRQATLSVAQSTTKTPGQDKKLPLHIPLKLSLLGANGHDIDLTLAGGQPVPDGVLHITEAQHRFVFTDVPARPLASLLRGFSAPVNVSVQMSDRDLQFLMVHDQDPFNRWQAGNTFATRTLVHLVTAARAGRRSARGMAYAKALGAVIADRSLDPAYRAELLKLPTPDDLARELGENVDPELIDRAHRQLSRRIARLLGSALDDIYRQMSDRRPFAPDAAGVGRRALRNAALNLLVARGTAADYERLAEHFFRARNMTDEAYGLVLLAGLDIPQRQAALSHFYERWKDDHLVIDTWFAAQARSRLASALADVEALTRHPLFNLTAPNKVRALIGTFASQNPVQFHRPDGRGYDFLVDSVLALDRFNPQIAARMLGALRSWRTLEPMRQARARSALTRVAKARQLSRDVTEIVSKILEA